MLKNKLSIDEKITWKINHLLKQKIITNWKRKTDRLAEREKQ